MIDDVRKNSMMAGLLDALGEGRDIGHYGRLVFVMVARHFATHEELEAALARDRDFSTERARELVAQVERAGYNPPKREKILEFQAKQEFAIIADPSDPDAGNVYKDLEFPDGVYHHIEEYQEQKAHAEA